MDRLLEGYRRFRTEVWPKERARYETLANEGQRPETLVIACSDSRVDPQTVFDAGPGELFVVRNVAALVPPRRSGGRHEATSAALEYGVRVLKVARIVVLSHAQCGGINTLVGGTPKEARDFVKSWMEIATPVVRALPRNLGSDERLAYFEIQTVRLSLANLMTFPWIEEAVAQGQLTLHGYRFEIRTGALSVLEGERFAAVE